MDKKARRFFGATIAGMLLVCIVMFSVITVYMTKRNSSTLQKVADTYMQGMSTQIQNHFETLVNMRLVQVKSIVQGLPPEEVDEMNDSVKSGLATMAELRQFTHLFLLDTKGNEEMLYGDPVEVENLDRFIEALNNDRTMVTAAKTEDGSLVLLYGISVGHPNGMG